MVYGCDFDTILCNCEDLGSLDYWPLDEAIECISFPTLLGRIHMHRHSHNSEKQSRINAWA